MNNLAVCFLHGSKDHLTTSNYNSIAQNIYDYPIYTCNQYDYDSYYYDFLDQRHISLWNPEEIWYWGCDNLFLYWYLSNPKKRYKQYLILEHDLRASSNVIDFLGIDDDVIHSNNGIISIKPFTYEANPNFWWFTQHIHHDLIKNQYSNSYLSASSPICGTLISDNAVKTIIDFIRNTPEINKFFSEIKFSTILKINNLPIRAHVNSEITDLYEYITWDENLCINKINENINNNINVKSYGLYHPIKTIDKINEYFNDSVYIDTKNISMCLFGINYNATNTIQNMINAGETEIPINNHLLGDPISGVRKTLKITYKKDGIIYHKSINEGEILSIEDL